MRPRRATALPATSSARQDFNEPATNARPRARQTAQQSRVAQVTDVAECAAPAVAQRARAALPPPEPGTKTHAPGDVAPEPRAWRKRPRPHGGEAAPPAGHARPSLRRVASAGV